MGDRPIRGDGRRQRTSSHTMVVSANSASLPSKAAIAPASPAKNNAPGSSQHPVPLPRVPNAQRRTSRSVPLSRVQHACEPCRRRKAKCDGTRPICARCDEQGIPCYYAEGKRDRTKRNTRNFASRISLYEGLLQELLPHQNYARQQEIRNVLDEAHLYPLEAIVNAAEGAGSDGDVDIEEESVGHTAGSPVSQNWHPLEDSRFEESTGFLGKASTVRWIEDVGEKLLSNPSASTSKPNQANQPKSAVDFNQLLLQAAKYHISEMDISSFGPYGEHAGQYKVPLKPIADALVHAYFTTMHPLFPIVLGPVFMAQYELFYQSSQPPSNLFLAILNLIFAIGAVYGHYTGNDWGSHLDYFVRSRLLSMEPLPMLHLPTLENIQVASLCGMYLVSSHQINRAWHIVGLAIRYAHSRGLHLINDNPGKTESQRELEARLWHSTCSLERLLGFLTGRTPAIRDKHTITRPPRRISDDTVFGQLNTPPIDVPWYASSIAMTSFCASLELDKICSIVLSEFYSASTALLSWSAMQKFIDQLNIRLGNWRSQLPPRLRIGEGPEPEICAPRRERMYLALRYFSTSMLINRPCLSIGEGSTGASSIPSWSSESKNFDHDSVKQCVASAKNLMALLPDDPNSAELYTFTPWWCVLHYIVQAGAVLIMETSLESSHRTDDTLEVAAKMLRWLKHMGENCVPAYRAWIALGRLLELTLSKSSRDIPKELSSLLPETILLEMRAGAGGALSSTYTSRIPSFPTIEPLNVYHGLQPPQRSLDDHLFSSSTAFLDPNFHMPILTPQNFWTPPESLLQTDWPMVDLSSYQARLDFPPETYYPEND